MSIPWHYIRSSLGIIIIIIIITITYIQDHNMPLFMVLGCEWYALCVNLAY
jgi:hypothetical protein